MNIFNAKTQKVEDAVMSVDHNNEIVATFADGSFVKFPAGLVKEDFDRLVALHQETNEGQEVITEEAEALAKAERLASLELIGETTQDESDQTSTFEEAEL